MFHLKNQLFSSPFRRRFIFEVLKHVRLPLVATKLLESYVNNCTDLSLKVAMSSVKKDLISQKGSLVALYVKPRKSAKKNIYVIGGNQLLNVKLKLLKGSLITRKYLLHWR